MSSKDIIGLDEFDRLVDHNKSSGKHWYHGLKSEWWWCMSKNHVRKHVIKLEEKAKRLEEERVSSGKIVLASTWNVKCGIATYTKYLLDNLNRITPNSFVVDPVIKPGELQYKSRGKLTHLQHEFDMMPKPPKIKGKLIITWHTVSKRTNPAIEKYESKYEVVAHIVHS